MTDTVNLPLQECNLQCKQKFAQTRRYLATTPAMTFLLPLWIVQKITRNAVMRTMESIPDVHFDCIAATAKAMRVATVSEML
jgi:hypothetical protein